MALGGCLLYNYLRTVNPWNFLTSWATIRLLKGTPLRGVGFYDYLLSCLFIYLKTDWILLNLFPWLHSLRVQSEAVHLFLYWVLSGSRSLLENFLCPFPYSSVCSLLCNILPPSLHTCYGSKVTSTFNYLHERRPVHMSQPAKLRQVRYWRSIH